jgi:UDP-N-acetylmuramyl tripeptide synthase
MAKVAAPSPPARTRVAALAGRATAAMSRALGKGEGSVIGGRVTLALDPHGLANLSRSRTVAVVSGTNGKTTTTSMLSAALGTVEPVATNLAGANMYGGMVSAMSSSRARLVVLEADEAHVPKTIESTAPRLIVLLNLSRDQLDRAGEVRMLAEKWRNSLEGFSGIVVANADDPMVVWAAQVVRSAVWVAAGSSWRLDAASCPNCGAQIDWNGGEWRCSSCELRRPEPHAFVTSSTVAARRVGGEVRVPLDLKIPGDVNRRNAAVALTAATLLGADPHKASRAIGRLEGTGGRFASVTIAGCKARLVLAKNPAGWTEALRIARPDVKAAVIGINARVQDGRDPSWLWDVPFEQLRGRFIVATGERGRDLAVRLRYAGVEHVFISDPVNAVQTAAQRAGGNHIEIDVMGNYSAFQDFRKVAR